jgi:protein-S-isoprenylcysteine O-methyltransferase Ste14
MIFSIPFTAFFLGSIFYLLSKDLFWFNGLIYISSLILYLLLIFIYFIIVDPDTLLNRSKISSDKSDNLFLSLVGILFLGILVLGPINYRLNWFILSRPFVWIGFLMVNISHLILFLVMRENSFASKGLIIHENQKVITTGLYKYVRHPMYSGFILMAIGVPLTLGSLPSLACGILLPLTLALRIPKEEAILKENLEGYSEYLKKTKYRIIPGIW